MVLPANDVASDQQDIDETVSATFHGCQYTVHMFTVEQTTLYVDVEQESNASQWKGSFSSEYIMEITGKTGNYKPYNVFIKMLVSSLKRTSDSVSIDLLTYSDLEVLKAKRLRRSGHDVPLPGNTVVNNKRYLILTYQGEFDKVHYPLPLPFVEHPDPAELKETIVRLREQAKLIQADTEELVQENDHLRCECNMLRRQLEDVQCRESQDGMRNSTLTAAEDAHAAAEDAQLEVDGLRNERAALEETVSGLEEQIRDIKLAHRRELRLKGREAAVLKEDLDSARSKIRELNVKIRHLQADADRQNRRESGAGRDFQFHSHPRPTSAVNPRRRASPYAQPQLSRSRPASAYSSAASEVSRASTASRARSTSLSARPASAPTRPPRFDPTQYVKQKRDRTEAALRAKHSRTFSPSSAHPRSPAPRALSDVEGATPRRSRSASAGARIPQWRGSSPRADVSGSKGRPSSVCSSGSAGRKSCPSQPLSRSASRSRDPARRQERMHEASPNQGLRKGTGRGCTASRGQWDSSPRARQHARLQSISPGRALLEVKEKLKNYRRQDGHNSSIGAGSLASQPGGEMSTSTAAKGTVSRDVVSHSEDLEAQPDDYVRSEEFKSDIPKSDTNVEIAEIDSRLQALQEFLKSAKQSAAQ